MLAELWRGLYWAGGLVAMAILAAVIDDLAPIALGAGYILFYLLMLEE